ncbi:uncharacterized protein BO97DRAFT_355050, partial [Aspergillus homomorphus CBS 101889]
LPTQPNNLYLLLLDRGSISTFHWTLYLATSPTHGTIFLINGPGSSVWEFESKTNEEATRAGRLLVALELGHVDPALHAALADCLARIPIEYSARFREAMTCRVWIKEALFALDDEGYVLLGSSVEGVEENARNRAMRNRVHGRVTVCRLDDGGF